MIPAHFAAVEKYLLALSQVVANTGHPLHKGTPREWFVREFLESHLSERVALGTGEVIDASSKPGAPRNQFDVVIYRRDYPKLDFGGGVSAFLAESVVATIEVKSVLDAAGVLAATRAAHNAKSLQRHLVNSFNAGYNPPHILSYVVAFDGPAKVATIKDWLNDALLKAAIPVSPLPTSGSARTEIPSPALEGVFVLGRGFVYYDNQPLSLINDALRLEHPNLHWVFADVDYQSLLVLFLFLTKAISGVSGSWLDPTAYVPKLAANSVAWSV